MRHLRALLRYWLTIGVLVSCASCNPLDAGRSETRGAAIRPVGTSKAPAPRGGPFTTASVWKTPITRAPVAKSSKPMVRKLVRQVTSRYNGVAAFNVVRYNVAFYTVSADYTRTTVIWDDCWNYGYVPDGVYGPRGQFVDVPIPRDAVPTAGTDSSLSVYQPATDTMWDFWQAKKRADGWHACWGGRLEDVSKSKGYFSGNFGTAATGLSLIGGAIGIKEAQAGRIDHAVALQIPEPAVWNNFSWPAQRSDGFDKHPHAIPEGTRLRLDPKVKVNRLKLHPLARMVALAAQKYGFIVTDKSGAVAVITESGAASKAATGKDPWAKLLRGTPDYEVMKNFPWQKLQALPKDYGKPGQRASR